MKMKYHLKRGWTFYQYFLYLRTPSQREATFGKDKNIKDKYSKGPFSWRGGKVREYKIVGG